MALFQKNPHSTHEHYSLFTLGANKTLLIVGLGNIGGKYAGTRHNIGFACIDAFAKAHEFDGWAEKRDFRAYVTQKTLGESRVILCKPTTLMNLSGEAVQQIMHFYKIKPGQIAAVYDELAIPFGQIRMRVGGSDAGHNGVKSLIKHVGADFARIRVGVDNDKPDKMDSSDYVLAKFSKDEAEQIPNLLRETTSIFTEYVYSGQMPHDTRSF